MTVATDRIVSKNSAVSTSTTDTSSTFRTVGNWLHGINLFNICLYGTSLYFYGNEKDGVFDSAWLVEGFCLPHGTSVFRTTHDYSAYAMILFALTGLWIRQRTQQQQQQQCISNTHNPKLTQSMQQADQMVFWAFMGALGHACGHFLLSISKYYDYLPPGNVTFLDDLRESSTWFEVLYKVGPGYPLFWIPLVKTYMMNTANNQVIAFVAFILNVGVLPIPSKFGFAYTQAVLFGGMSIDQLLLPASKKDTFEYAMWPLLTTIPNGVFAWMECLTCTSSWIMQQHGHIVYDMYMVNSYTAFYILCLYWNQRRFQTIKQKTV